MANRTAPVQIKIRLTEEEAQQLKVKIAESGLTQQEYIKRCALGRKIQNTEGAKLLVPELKRIGNNLNQVARHMNEGNYPSLSIVEDNQKELKNLWQQLRQFLQKHH